MAQDEDEFIHLQTLSVEESLQMAQSGKIQDAKSLATLLLARTLLLK
jgi:hypothetical protein